MRQQRIVDAHLVQVLMGAPDIVRILARDAFALTHQREHRLFGQASGILLMVAVGDVGERIEAPAVVEPQRQPSFEIDGGRLLTGAQVVDRLVGLLGGDAEGDAAADAAPIEAEHQSRNFRRAAMDMRQDAQGAMVAV